MYEIYLSFTQIIQIFVEVIIYLSITSGVCLTDFSSCLGYYGRERECATFHAFNCTLIDKLLKQRKKTYDVKTTPVIGARATERQVPVD